MKARTLLALVAALSVGSAAQAVDFTTPDLDEVIDYAAVVDVDLMYADLEVIDTDRLKGYGKVTHYVWSDFDGNEKQHYKVVVNVRVPSKVPGFESLEAAWDADVRIGLYSEGVKYGECMLAAQLYSSRTYVTYELQLAQRNGEVKPIKGVCDIDVVTPGTQVGIPQMHRLDLIKSFVRSDTRPDYNLMKGLCY